MNFARRTLLFAAPLVLLPLAWTGDADACGGCFAPPASNTQVVGHRMILSLSPQETTLWDQFQYAGEPESFAWVLPTKGIVEVGLSSDALFNQLEAITNPVVLPPPRNCPAPPSCYAAFGDDDLAMGGGAPSAEDGSKVNVLAEEVVGPYETVQLESTDPDALTTWLAERGYSIPADIHPVIAQYVEEKFNFLALKLVPGQGVDAMRPVRISAPGAGFSLPLRMVAAGVGVSVPVTLWVLGESRHEPQNFPSFEIAPSELVWNWDTQSSNYDLVREAGYDASDHEAWLLEASEGIATWSIENALSGVVNMFPEQSGYGDGTYAKASEELHADLDKLYGNIPPETLWVTRMRAELPRAALGKDLQIAPSPGGKVVRTLQTTKAIGTAPPCPVYSPCDVTTGKDGFWPGEHDEPSIEAAGSCALPTTRGARNAPVTVILAALGATLACLRRRRRPRA